MPEHVDPIALQHRLFSELSRMFGEEVPLYDLSLRANLACNRIACALLEHVHAGFSISDAELDRASAERHGAIRIGRDDEFRWIARFFACFGMEPHNFYDMTDVGAKSQPIIATAFRSMVGPEHRVFSSLLRPECFDDVTRERLVAALADRDVFGDRARALIERAEAEGGLAEADAAALIEEACTRIFRWTGRAHDHSLFSDLCDAGVKIAADIACFESHHLNHLTPNTWCMDLYTAAMRHVLGELDAEGLRAAAGAALRDLATQADADWLILHARHLDPEAIDGFERREPSSDVLAGLADDLVARFGEPDLAADHLPHHGFKDHTEGPPTGVPILLRQDAYRALTEPVTFVEADGSTVETDHTARFGEIEQRFHAMTPEGRSRYDACLTNAIAARADAGDDRTAGDAAFAACFDTIPRTLPELLAGGLVYGRARVTAAGRAAAASGPIDTADLEDLERRGFIRRDGLRYEDFLPVSAAGIFASNLQQYGTTLGASVTPTFTAAVLEEVMGRTIVDSMTVARGQAAEATRVARTALGVTHLVTEAERRDIDEALTASPATGGRTHRPASEAVALART